MGKKWQSFKNFFKKESRTTSILVSPGSSGKIEPQRDYDNFAKETYLKNATAFAAIKIRAQSAASVRWKEYRKTKDGKSEVVEDSAIVELLKRPNPNESFEFLMLSAIAYLTFSGNAFLERVSPDSGPNKNEIKELYVKRPDRFEIKLNPITGQLEKYIYKVDGREVEWEVDPITMHADILHLKTFHPLNDFWGAAATESASREIDTSNYATEWNMNLLQNQSRPGMIFSLIGATGERFMDQIEQSLREAKSGPSNVGKDLILTGENGTKAMPYGWSPTDMDFDKGDQRLMRKISMSYGVPPELLGIQSDTFNNRSEARLFFWEETVLWDLNYIRGELNNWLYEENSETYIDYVLDDVPALALKREKLWKRAKESDFLTLDEKRELVGKDKYEPDINNPGSIIFIEASKIPIGIAAEDDEEEDEEETVKSLKAQGYNDEEINNLLGYET